MKQRNQVILRSFVRRRRSRVHARSGGVGVDARHDGGVGGRVRVPEVAVPGPLATRPWRLDLLDALLLELLLGGLVG